MRAPAAIAPRALSLLAAGGLALSGCGTPPNTLEGSMDEVSSLQFDTVVLRATSSVLSLEYDRHPQGAFADGGAAAGSDTSDVAFKMTVLIAGLTLSQGLDIDLTSHLPDGTPRVACSRTLTGDPRREFPPIVRGDLVLDSSVNYGQTATGHFDITFGEGGDLGEGRTVNGTYSTAVVNANPGSSS